MKETSKTNGSGVGEPRKRDLAEVEYRGRARSPTVAATCHEMSHATFFDVEVEMEVLAKTDLGDGLLMIPSGKERLAPWRPTTYGAAPPNPYGWAPVLHRWYTGEFTLDGYGHRVCEISVGEVASAVATAHFLGQEEPLLICPPDPCLLSAWEGGRPRLTASMNSTPWFAEEMGERAALLPGRVGLVLVPLPLTADLWSVRQHRTLLAALLDEAIGRDSYDDAGKLLVDSRELGLPVGPPDLHPEFCVDRETWLMTVRARLAALPEYFGPSHFTAAVLAPCDAGAAVQVESDLNRDPRWRLLLKYTVVHRGGRRHRGDGRALLPEVVSVWDVTP